MKILRTDHPDWPLVMKQRERRGRRSSFYAYLAKVSPHWRILDFAAYPPCLCSAPMPHLLVQWASPVRFYPITAITFIKLF
jgi:hypothetical protein